MLNETVLTFADVVEGAYFEGVIFGVFIGIIIGVVGTALLLKITKK